METNLFPASIAQQTVEVYDSKISVRSSIIYLIILGFLVSAVIALPLVYVDVAVQARGTFQSALQRNSLIASVGGRIEQWNLLENQKVKKGDVLALIRNEQIHLEMIGFEERLTLVQSFMNDLQKLVNIDLEESSLAPIRLQSNYYQASFLEFQSKLSNHQTSLQKLTRDYERAQILFESKSIAFAEYDNTEAQYMQAKTQLELLKKQQINLWEQELVNYQQEKIRLKSQLDVFSEQMDQYKIIAGTNGTLINVLNLNKGDFIHPHQKLAEISPDTTLIAVTYISPMDIAFVEIGQEVSFQVDAYNYNQWGLATGKVIDIADDLTLINEKEAGFLVTCALASPHLTLTTGQEGLIKKGMTFNARFVVARRSLYQLLYDKVDNWINPQVQLPS